MHFPLLVNQKISSKKCLEIINLEKGNYLKIVLKTRCSII